MITIKDMLDSGVHFGHQTQRWNPKMKPYVYSSRGGIHIIDLQKTLDKTKAALDYVEKQAALGKKLIFVGTKKQAVEAVQDAAKNANQYFVTKRWLGGTLTNFVTIKQSIDRLKKIDQMREKGELNFFSKKERSRMEKEYQKLNDYLEGIREMKEPPEMMFIVDITKEHIAVKEAKNLGVSVIGICDTNADPEEVDFPIPGNDDAIRSIKLFCNQISEAYMNGAKKYQEKRRADSDKASDLAEEMLAKPKKKKEAKPSESGPAVVKVSKGRKLVAAGTADEIEILHEVEMESTTAGTDTATKAAVDAAASTESATTPVISEDIKKEAAKTPAASDDKKTEGKD